MLGTGLGQKVDAQFVKEGYKTFLNKDEKPKKALTKEENREECRKKGIFVVADDEEFTPTVFEKTNGECRPAVCIEKSKGLRWKKKGTVRQVQSEESKKRKKGSTVTAKEKKTTEKPQKETAVEVSEKTTTEESKKGSDVTKKGGSGVEAKKGKKNKKNKHEAKKESGISAKSEKKAEIKEKRNPTRTQMEKLAVTTARSTVTAVPPPASSDASPSAEPLDGLVSVTGALSLQEPDCLTAMELADLEDASNGPRASSVHSSSSYTLRQPLGAVGPITKKDMDDVFGTMKEEDDEFEKILAQEKVKCAETDKEAVITARKILQVAHKEKAFDKVLTKEENEVLIQFFSGKIPYNDKVLKTLDKALDKTIDWMKTHKVKMNEETKSLIEKRGAVKAAMFEAILTSPQYIPKSWAKKYEELREQSKKETSGINWARVLLCYPNQKRFGDGPEDKFGNFTRGKRHWILELLLGPSDSKTFEETQREEQCKGMYFDTAIMEKAKKHADEDVSLMTSGSTVTARK